MENMSAYSDQCFFEGEEYQGRNYLEKHVLQNVGFCDRVLDAGRSDNQKGTPNQVH